MSKFHLSATSTMIITSSKKVSKKVPLPPTSHKATQEDRFFKTVTKTTIERAIETPQLIEMLNIFLFIMRKRQDESLRIESLRYKKEKYLP
jgi:hypothetical protein